MIISYYYNKLNKENNDEIIFKIKKKIPILNKICIIFIGFNFTSIRLNILSPKELKIFYDKNKILINIIYSFLGLYTILYFIQWIYILYQIKIKTITYKQFK